jgi:tetratricopeptide (TPR) repeat protein
MLVAVGGVLAGARAAASRRGRFAWGILSAGMLAWAAGDAAAAAAAFLAEAGKGTARDTAFYNAGTAALEAGRLDVARGALAEAAKSLDPALRYRALYNLGLADLLAAEADTTREEEFLEDAVDRLRQALLLEPSSARAKWNLELADRRRPPPPSGGGGGGAGTPPPQGGGQSEAQRAPETPRQGLSQSQAEQILNSMERRERETRAEQQRRLQAGSAGGVKDW